MTRKLLPNAVPKPDPQPEKPWSRSSIKEPSHKEKIALLRAQPPRKPIAKKKRTTSEFARIYGSKQRVAWVKSQPCVACGVVGFSENAHVANDGQKGMGRKSGFHCIVPLCGPHFVPPDLQYYGCHQLLHDQGPESWTFKSIDLELEADRTHSRWEDFAETLAWNGHRGRR